MSNSMPAEIIIPPVVVLALAAWMFMIHHANRHPGTGSGTPPRDSVAGGAFRGSAAR